MRRPITNLNVFIVNVEMILMKSTLVVSMVLLKISTGCYVFPVDIKNPCTDRKCSFGAVCVSSLDGLSARCQCPDRCYSFGDNEGGQTLCGTDGVEYGNTCELRRTSCREMRDIVKKFEGKCDPCRGILCPDQEVCRLDGRRNPVCQCSNVCSEEHSPVCASDGRTYENKCSMELEGCRIGGELKFVHSGNCSRVNACHKIKCDFYGECHLMNTEKQRCVCRETCEPIVRPVCGSDGRSYDNICEMRKRSCTNKRWIRLSRLGLCDNQLLDASNPTSKDKSCNEIDCHYGSECVSRDDRAVCLCPNCTDVPLERVCGSDEKTYKNECELKLRSCTLKMKIDIRHKGPCVDCEQSKFGCCPQDPDHVALGPDAIGCPSSCQCNVMGSLSAQCDLDDLQCHCKRGVGGSKCDRCETTFWGFPKNINRNDGCLACNCSTFGSVRSDCEQSTGKCRCKTGFSGQQCDVCSDGSIVRYNTCSGQGHSINSGCIQNVTCKFGGSCVELGQTFSCVCPATCRDDNDGGGDDDDVNPVCGSDGMTYKSRCHVEQATCRFQTNIMVSRSGKCSDTKDLSQVSIKFDGETVHEFKRKLKDGRRTSIKMELKTIQSEGLVFLEAKSRSTSFDFVAIGLSSGRLEVIFNLGKDASAALPSVQSTRKVNDNNWHVVSVERKGRMLKILVDDEKAQVTHSTAGAVNFNSKGIFTIGGSNKNMEDLPMNFKKQFRGCLRKMSVDSQEFLDQSFIDANKYQHCDANIS